MADRRSQSDESLIVEYFTVQPLAACDALLNQIADILRKRRPKRTESGNNARPAAEHTERKPSQKRKAQTVSVASETVVGISDNARCGKSDCARFFDDNIHHKKLAEGYHEFVEPAGEVSKGVGV